MSASHPLWTLSASCWGSRQSQTPQRPPRSWWQRWRGAARQQVGYTARAVVTPLSREASGRLVVPADVQTVKWPA